MRDGFVDTSSTSLANYFSFMFNFIGFRVIIPRYRSKGKEMNAGYDITEFVFSLSIVA